LNPIPRIKQIVLFLIAGVLFETAAGQTVTVTGTVVDSTSKVSMSNVTVGIAGTRRAVVSDMKGRFRIRVDSAGQLLVFTAVGYLQQKVVADTAPMVIYLSPNFMDLKMVVIKGHRGKYRNKNNPAVELIRKVIANNHRTGRVPTILPPTGSTRRCGCCWTSFPGCLSIISC
jgi:hypothetical protein